MALTVPAPSNNRRTLRPWRRLLLAAALACLVGWPVPHAQAQVPTPKPKAPAEIPSWAFGDRVVVRNCLRFLVTDYRDRQSDVDNHDWIRLRVENVCRGPIRSLLVEILLVDTQGRRYGTPVWVIGKGEQLIPGGHWEEDVAIPDPDSRVARRWAMRVLRVDGLPKPPPAAAKK